MRKFLHEPWVADIGAVYCSTEQKAIDGARIVAEHLCLSYEMYADLGENDRSSTGYLTKAEFEKIADQFFANPDSSIRGWETALSAQQRIRKCINAITHKEKEFDRNIMIVSHGGVGALYLSYLKQCPIDRAEDQPDTGGGNYYAFQIESQKLLHGWRPIDGE